MPDHSTKLRRLRGNGCLWPYMRLRHPAPRANEQGEADLGPPNGFTQQALGTACNSWIWLTGAIPPIAIPLFQAKQPKDMLNTENVESGAPRSMPERPS